MMHVRSVNHQMCVLVFWYFQVLDDSGQYRSVAGFLYVYMRWDQLICAGGSWNTKVAEDESDDACCDFVILVILVILVFYHFWSLLVNIDHFWVI